MGKVIPFRRPAVKEPTQERLSANFNGGSEKHFADMVEEIKEKFEERGIEIDVTFRISDFLRSMRGHISLNAVATARNAMRGMSFEELKDIARNSSPAVWRAKPGYFRALVDEIRSRS